MRKPPPIAPSPRKRSRSLAAIVACLTALVPAAASPGAATEAPTLRVCADPDNMPFSNAKGEGFENKLAELVASKLGARLEYSWFPEATGYVPNTVGADACDLVMGYAQGTGLIDDTNPYYHTAYVLVYRADDESLAGVERLSDPRLKDKKIGYFARTLPASILAIHGLMGTAMPFEMRAYANGGEATAAVLEQIATGTLDAAILWGPVAGYYAAKTTAPLKLVPLVKETAGPRTIYAITMGVRPNEPQWKHKINKVIAENQGEINLILASYNVPVLDENGNPIATATADR